MLLPCMTFAFLKVTDRQSELLLHSKEAARSVFEVEIHIVTAATCSEHEWQSAATTDKPL